MRNIWLKVACAILALTVLCAFVACSGDEEETEKETESSSETVGGSSGTEAPEDTFVFKGSAGLEYANNAYGSTCYMQGLGTFTGTKLDIPSRSEEGNTVIGLKADAFTGEIGAAITEMNIPSAVKRLEAGVFDNCTSLTLIRYFGSENYWNEMLADAGIESLPEGVTVEFCRYYDLTVNYVYLDGTEAKESKVESYINDMPYSVTAPAIEGYRADVDLPTGVMTEDVTVTVTYTKVVYSGTCGDSLTWVYYEDNELRIGGTGEMRDYVDSAAPWTPFASEIALVTFEDTVESVGAYAFANCFAIQRIELPAGLRYVGAHAFDNWTSAQTILFSGGVDILVLMDAVWNSGVQAEISFLYGACEQDGDLVNGEEPIEWMLTESDNGAYLLTTRNLLFCSAFHSMPIDTNWENSSLRAFLNGEFANYAFTEEERAAQVTVQKGIGTEDDLLFVLSTSELSTLFAEEKDRIFYPTVAADPTLRFEENEEGDLVPVADGNPLYWWLRDSGDLGLLAQNVSPTGVLNSAGALVSTANRGVLISVWVKPTID